ncbi:MAG: Gfo/Idh/MocA family oxidoreductase [Oscillospiraceae bacterium]|nr:Gfo/Idh/MocA family oxidoreductase [Oscillospiraceae bacterium]
MIRYGILSTSSIAPRFIAAVRESGTGEIVAVSSRTIEKAREKASEWNISSAYGSHGELLEDENVEAVYISAVNSQHYRWAKEALLHGKHVICEKPCTIRKEDTRELFAIAKERGLFLMEAQKMLFLPAILEAKKRIASGALGSIRVAEFTHSFDGSYNAWMYDEAAGGGPLLSSAIYVIELLQFLFECRVADIGGYCTKHPGTNVEEQYVLTGRMENGVLFSLKNSTVALMKNGAALYGEQGWAELPDYWKARQVTFRLRSGEEETLRFPCEHELIYEANHIADCMERGLLESPVVTGEFSAAAIAVLEKVKALWK